MEVRRIGSWELETGQTVLVESKGQKEYFGIVQISRDGDKLSVGRSPWIVMGDLVKIVLILRNLPTDLGTIIGFRNNLGQLYEGYICHSADKWLQFYNAFDDSVGVFAQPSSLYSRGDWEIVDKWV